MLAQEAGRAAPVAGADAVAVGDDKTEKVTTPEMSFLELLEAGMTGN